MTVTLHMNFFWESLKTKPIYEKLYITSIEIIRFNLSQLQKNNIRVRKISK